MNTESGEEPRALKRATKVDRSDTSLCKISMHSNVRIPHLRCFYSLPDSLDINKTLMIIINLSAQSASNSAV